MFSKRDRENELKIDHRNSPGITPEQAAELGVTPVARGTVYHSATVTCSHCQRQIVLNPLRTRDRGYCPKCDGYTCDLCEAERVASGGKCLPFTQVVDLTLEAATHGRHYDWDAYPITRPSKPPPQLVLPFNTK